MNALIQLAKKDLLNQKKKIKANRDFWIPKIERNMQKDKENNKKLEVMGFKVFRFWAEDVNKNIDSCLGQVLGYISKESKGKGSF